MTAIEGARFATDIDQVDNAASMAGVTPFGLGSRSLGKHASGWLPPHGEPAGQHSWQFRSTGTNCCLLSTAMQPLTCEYSSRMR